MTSSYGIEGFTPDHLAAFKRYGTERVLIGAIVNASTARPR